MNIENGEELNFCRLCLQRTKDMIDLFTDDRTDQLAGITLPAKIMACVAIEVSPTAKEPKKICSKCLNSVNAWHEFKMMCENANNILQKYIQEVMKNKSTLEKNTSEDSLIFPEISLFNCDSLLERSISFGSNLSITNLFFNTDKNKEKADIEQSSKECNEQIEEFQQSSLLEKNEIIVEEKKGYKCQLCNKLFTQFSTLLTHDETNHSTEARKFTCTVCGRLFILHDRLITHTKLAHRKKSFQCPICDKFFVSSKSLKVHSRLHSEKYKCSKCGFLSTSKIYLEQHEQKHDGIDVPLECDICHKKFSQKSSLRRHQNLHSENHGRCFKCSICCSLFRSHSELKYHMYNHNRITENFPCRTCGKNFKSKKVLKGHLQRHKEPQYCCSICEKKFKFKYDLSVHTETHSDSKTFECFQCNKKFSYKNTLVRHLKKHRTLIDLT